MRRALLHACTAAALAACQPSPSPTPAPARRDAAAPTVAVAVSAVDAGPDVPVVPPGPSTLRDACEALTGASLARWDEVAAAHRGTGLVLYLPASRAVVREKWSCVGAIDGAWALSLDGTSLGVAFVRPDGSVARVTPPGCAAHATTPGFASRLIVESRDGRSEALLTCDSGRSQRITVGPTGLSLAALPFDGTAARLEDVDRDGRTDVVGTLGSDHPLLAGGTVSFVAHARPSGDFSLDDEVARVVLRGQCPERPTGLLVARDPSNLEGGPNRPSEVARRVLCARVWNVPLPEITAFVDRAQTEGERPDPFRDPDSAIEPAATPPADGGALFPLPRAALLALARTVHPPLQLHPTRSAALTPSSDAGAGAPIPAVDPSDGGAEAPDAAVTPPGFAAPIARACEATAAHVRRLTEVAPRHDDPSRADASPAEGEASPVAQEMAQVRASLGRCVAARGGAWVLALRSLERRPEREGPPAYLARWAPDFITTEGTRIEGPVQPPLLIEPCDHDALTLPGTSDFDGDARGELAVAGTHFWCGDGDGDNPFPVRVFSVRDGRVERYAPFDAVGAVQSARDFDRDGRLDFIDEDRWGRVQCDPAQVGVDDSAGPLSLWHARPDGTFTRLDPVTRSFARACTFTGNIYEASENNPWSRYDSSPALFNAVCARAHGWSAEQVQLRALAELAARGPDGVRFQCNDFAWLSWRLVIAP